MDRIMVVDDEEQITRCLGRLLRRAGFQVELALDAEQALARLDDFRPDLILSDFRMPRMNGAEFLAVVRRRMPLTLRLILSGYADIDSLVAAVNAGGIFRFLRKPWDDADLIDQLRRALENRRMLATLYEPFRQAGAGVVTDVVYEETRLSIAARLVGRTFTTAEAAAIVRQFNAEVSDAELRAVSSTLEANTGRLVLVAQIGGEPSLTLELPITRTNS